MKIDIEELKKAMQHIALNSGEMTLNETSTKIAQAAADNVIDQLIKLADEDPTLRSILVEDWLNIVKEQQ